MANSPSRQHDGVPDKTMISEVGYVALAFMRSSTFNELEQSTWPLFTTVERARKKFVKGTVTMVVSDQVQYFCQSSSPTFAKGHWWIERYGRFLKSRSDRGWSKVIRQEYERHARCYRSRW